MAKLKEPLFAVPDGELHPKWFDAGEEVSGAVAVAARAQGKLAEEAPKPAATEPVEEKPKKRGRPMKAKAMKAPENK